MGTTSDETMESIIGQVEQKDIYDIIKSLLFALCFKNKLIGTKYLTEVLAISCSHSYHETSLSAGAYAIVARKHNSTVSSVERAIRTAIKDCHQNGNLQLLNKLFIGGFIDADYPPSNGELIAEIVAKLRYYLETVRGIRL